MSLPERDKLSYSKQWCEARLVMTFGGRVAEQIIYGKEHLNTGASSDIMQSTDLARRMVTEWGMSDKLGPLNFSGGGKSENVFLGREIAGREHVSEETSRMIDEEIRHIVERNYQRARQVLQDNVVILHAMSKALLEYETIEAEDIEALMKGQALKPRAPEPVAAPAQAAQTETKDGEKAAGTVIDLAKPVKA